MFRIYMTKAAQDKASKDFMYLVFQTTRIFNCLRVFILIADDIRRNGSEDNLTEKKYVELLFSHAANLNEVLVTLREDLFARYRVEIHAPELLDGLARWEDRVKANDETVRLLTAIRNKHSFHVAHDEFYPWNYIKDEPAKQDILIGLGETMQGSGWFFTLDLDLLMAYIADKVFVNAAGLAENYARVKKLIDDASVDLYHLFSGILREMLQGKIYNVGKKEEAARDYRADPPRTGT